MDYYNILIQPNILTNLYLDDVFNLYTSLRIKTLNISVKISDVDNQITKID